MRKGLIPTLLGTAVTGASLAARVPDVRKRGIRNNDMGAMIATGLLGFGLAHVVLGSIDLVRGR